MRRLGVLVVALAGCQFTRGARAIDAAGVDSDCVDSDGDGVCDVDDDCPADPAKSAPGVCGCSIPDTDTDSDGVADCLGCSDGQREGFSNITRYPNIAACAGGWQVAGMIAVASACSHGAGDDSAHPLGQGCSAADLCQGSWRICSSAADVAASGGGDCADTIGSTSAPVFFATGQSGPGSLLCGETGANDLFGCGSLGVAPDPSCRPLTRASQNLCSSLMLPWNCGTDSYNEARNVIKPGPEAGGVLCCRTPT